MITANIRRQTRCLLAWLPLLAPVSGCAEDMSTATKMAAAAPSAALASASSLPTGEAPAGRQEGGQTEGKAPAPAMPRKIIYNGYVDLVVNDFEGVEVKVLALLEGKGGYVSETNVTGSPGSQRTGSWKVRVPAENFAAVMNAFARLGELRSTRIDSQDVSQEYYDVEARIAVKRQEEKRLLKILDEAAGKLKDILEVEKELSRVRSETEQMEGRLRWLAHNSALSTVNITVTEIKDYKPPVAPTFGDRLARAFEGSTANLGEFLMNAAIAVVALVPWLVLIVPGLLLGWLVWLVARRRTRIARV